MNTTLFFLVPVGMLAVAWSFCFIGCVFQTGGIAIPYSNVILAEQGLVAYWPLGDMEGSTAVDLTGHGHDGTYTIPPAYPVFAQSAPLTNPALNQHQSSIVPGDVSGSGVVDQNLFPGSADFEGGYVSIPWSTQNSPQLDEFTFEAWIRPKWTGSGFLRVLFGAATATAGIAIFIDQNNQWRFTIGNGTTLMELPPTNVSIDPSSATPTYVAVTWDPSNGGTLNLWINPQSQSDTNNPPPPPPTLSIPNTPYVAADPSQLLAIFIGAGANNQPLRTATTNPNGAPLFPYQGLIQSVALYNTALSGATLQKHFADGQSA
jgi:hypothetical protein